MKMRATIFVQTLFSVQSEKGTELTKGNKRMAEKETNWFRVEKSKWKS